MAVMASLNIKIDEFGQILLPLKINQELNLRNNDWLKVNITSDSVVLTPSREVDGELIEKLIQHGVLINVE